MPNLVPFLAYVVVTTFTPGPNNILAMSNAVHQGYRRTQRFLVGIAAGFLVVLLICGLLNVLLAQYIPQVHSWLNILGAAYLVYLAAHIALSKPSQDGPAPERLNTFRAGFALQFVNLKGILYGVTVFAMFVTPVYQNPAVVGLFAALLAGVAFVSVTGWALGGNLFRTFLSKYERWFNLSMAALLVYTAAASVMGSLP